MRMDCFAPVVDLSCEIFMAALVAAIQVRLRGFANRLETLAVKQ